MRDKCDCDTCEQRLNGLCEVTKIEVKTIRKAVQDAWPQLRKLIVLWPK